LGAKLVGRWQSGAPTMRAASQDNRALAADDCANNDFEFATDITPVPATAANQCDDTFGDVPADPAGDICPWAAHIRKSYPRDDSGPPPSSYQSQPTSPAFDESDTQTHRLLRRGIPYGTSSTSTLESPNEDGTDRGLLFLAYMTSIVDQFEFVTKNWVNTADFKAAGAGIDPILGQSNGADGSRQRTFRVRSDGADHDLQTDTDWVIPTGGGYFFAPSIDAIQHHLASTPAT